VNHLRWSSGRKLFGATENNHRGDARGPRERAGDGALRPGGGPGQSTRDGHLLAASYSLKGEHCVPAKNTFTDEWHKAGGEGKLPYQHTLASRLASCSVMEANRQTKTCACRRLASAWPRLRKENQQTGGRIPSGDHPLKLERYREDWHGPCARVTRTNREA